MSQPTPGPRPLPDPAAAFDLAALDDARRDALQALALGAGHRARTWVGDLLFQLGWQPPGSRRYSHDAVKDALQRLRDDGHIVEHSLQTGYWQVHPRLAAPVYASLLERASFERLSAALIAQEDIAGHYRATAAWRFPNRLSAIALVRLALFSGRPASELASLRHACGWGMHWDEILAEALDVPMDTALFGRLHRSLQAEVLHHGLTTLHLQWRVDSPLPLLRLAEDLLVQAETDPEATQATTAARLAGDVARHYLLAGRFEEIAPVLQGAVARAEPLDAAAAQDLRLLQAALEAARLFRLGRWSDSAAAYERALADLRKHTGRRKGALPELLGWPAAAALMAQQQPAALQRALKLALAEGGRKQPVNDGTWGATALALQMRLGERPRDLTLFQPHTRGAQVWPLDFWHWQLRAWLADGSERSAPLTVEHLRAADLLRNRLTQAGLFDLAIQVTDAVATLQGESVSAHYYAGQAQEGWRTALAALAAIGHPEPVVRAQVAETPETRLRWVISVDDEGGVEAIEPTEQTLGPRGWSRPKPVPLNRLARLETLPPWDAAVARAIRPGAYERTPRLDLAAAAVALIDHPCVEFEDRPGLAVTLVETVPELDVVDEGDQLRVRLSPMPRFLGGDEPDTPATRRWAQTAAEQKEVEALRALTVVRDEPTRARLIRLSPAQRRVAQLVGRDGLVLPKAAVGELQPVLQSLGAHFQVHADDVAASRDVPADARLRAELEPSGDGVQLRLVVAPFGPEGPRLNPGSGRTRLIASIGGETLGVQRDPEAERGHLETVLDACPMLAPPRAGAPASWTIEQPEAALALLERLHTLNAVAALDWPKGRAIRVDSVGLGQLTVNVRARNEWLALDGGLQLDEQLVCTLSKLLDWGADSASRFLPLGDGRYLALTEELRSRLTELSTVAETAAKGAKDGEARVAALAASWLEGTLAGADVHGDAAFRDRVERLLQAQQTTWVVPPSLQATLRPYQEDGYVWAMRLADCGLGACLADDMGLGKTLQALAVLLARAADGPALVIAPTSLIGNWQAEARRFAPTLRVQVYAEADGAEARRALVEAAGPHDLVLTSYQLAQMDAEVFTTRPWHTLVLDEAQAIKNASAKRSQAAFEIGGAFRLALSGTPIENRLSELWSIMRVCNPGLLGTLAAFNQRFAIPIERDRHRGAQRTLRRLVGPFVLRRTKAEVLDDLPPRTELTLQIEPDATERAHYEALRRQAVTEATEALKGQPGQAHLNILAQLTKLRRAACDPRLVTPELGRPGAKVQAFAELATELAANGHKALVFSQFVDFLTLLREPLDAAGIAYQYLDGSTPAAERSRRVAAFQAGEGTLFLISLKAGGFGLNLTAADYVVIADPWWNPAAEDQASGRAHRIGQQRPVTVYRLVNQGTLEEKIVALHQDKRELAEGVLAADEHGELGSALRADELVALMQGELGR